MRPLALMLIGLGCVTTPAFGQEQSSEKFIMDSGFKTCGEYLRVVHGHAPGIARSTKSEGEPFYDSHSMSAELPAGRLHHGDEHGHRTGRAAGDGG